MSETTGGGRRLEEMLREQRAANKAWLAEEEAKRVAAGGEAFDLARFEQLIGAEPGSRRDEEEKLRRRYYLFDRPTLAEFVEVERDLELHWDE